METIGTWVAVEGFAKGHHERPANAARATYIQGVVSLCAGAMDRGEGPEDPGKAKPPGTVQLLSRNMLRVFRDCDHLRLASLCDFRLSRGCDAGRQRGRLIMSLLRTLLALEYVGHEDDLTMRVA